MSKWLIKKGHVVDPSNEIDGVTDIMVEEGRITRVGQNLESGNAKVFDASGKLVFPGLIDMHVHLREPGREDEETVITGVRAAVRGGFSAIAAMPNTDPVADKASVIELVLERAEKAKLAKVLPVGAITKGLKGEELAEMGELSEAGAIAFSDDGHSVMNSHLLRRALEYSKIFNKPLILHEEDTQLAMGGQVNEGFYSTLLGLRGLPAAAEEVLIARDLTLARLTGAKIHLAHLSTKGSVELVRQAKKEGLPVTCEVTPHHLVLTHEALMGFDTNLKVNPPLRSRDDVEALREGLRDGTIDAIASDHAPHAQQEKEQEFDKAPFGIIGLETSLALVLTEVVSKGLLDYAGLVEKMSLNPAQVLGLPMGTLSPGAEANLTIVDPGVEFMVEPAAFESKSRNSPFKGWNLKGKATDVFVAGRLVMKDGRIV